MRFGAFRVLAEAIVKKLLVLLVLVFVVIAVAAYWATPSSKQNGEEGFTLVPVEFGTLVESISAPGAVQPRSVSVVGSRLSGVVVKIYANADYGHNVVKDEPLVELDRQQAEIKLMQAKTAVNEAKAALAAAEAQRNLAEVTAQYIKELVAKAINTKPQGEEAEYRLKAAEEQVKTVRIKIEQAENAVKEAQLGVDYSTIRAPISGTIIDRKIVDGQLVAPPASAQLFTIASDMSEMQVNVGVAQSDVGKIHPGMDATFTVDAYQDITSPFRGKIEQIRPMPTNISGAVYYSTIIGVQNRRDPYAKEYWMLRPGMTASVDIRLREHKDVWKLPAAVLNLQLDEHFQDELAKAKLREWQSRKDANDWKPAWVMKNKKPWPEFVRLGGTNARGETGIKDGQFAEILDWDPDIQPKPDPKNPETYPQVIIAAPPAHKAGLFNTPNLKLW
jgi:HlyD family secretion protein